MAEKGLFVVIDGCEGAGKSTQICWLAEAFRIIGREVLLTLEPGEGPVGQEIRHILLSPEFGNLCDTAELLLFLADRSEHCAKVVKPALERGLIVICDRFESSTLAYQLYETDAFDDPTIRYAMELSKHGVVPDIALIFDLDPEIGMARKFGDEPDRIEQKALDFHQRVRRGYLRYIDEHDFAVVVDADDQLHVVHERIIQAANERLNLNLPVLDL